VDKWVIGGAAAALLLMAKGKAAGVAVGLNAAKIERFAQAIAYAEGFNVAGSVPQRNHNPGDLKISSVPNVGRDRDGHLIFATDADGWLALRRQVEYIVSGQSSVYTLEMTIAQMAAKYAEWSGNWARNVAARLNVTEGTTLRAVLT
jgi:hypothetical protein